MTFNLAHNQFSKSLILVGLVALLAASCNSVKRLGDDEYLLNKNIIHINQAKQKDALKPIIKQQPNRKILGTRFYLHIYNSFDSGDTTRFKSWMKKTLGEPPVILDSALTSRTSEQFLLYLHNRGFFNATVSDSVHHKGRKKVNVHYIVDTGQPYTIRNISYKVEHPVLNKIIDEHKNRTFLIPGMNYDVDSLQKERERLTQRFKNTGYYYFNREFIYFEADSSLKSSQIDLFFGIDTSTDSITPSSAPVQNFKPYHIRNIYYNSYFDPRNPLPNPNADTVAYGGINFVVWPDANKLNYNTLARNVMLSKGDLYQTKMAELTYNRLSSLNIYRFINIRFDAVPPDMEEDSIRYLDCQILLTPQMRQAYSIEAEGTHSGGNLGIAGNIAFRNKNLMGGAESLELKIKGGMEVQRAFSDSESSTDKVLFFNTLEIGPELKVTLKRLVVPFFRISGYNLEEPGLTTISTSYNFQQRPEYQRRIFNLATGYEFKTSPYISQTLYPVDFNYVQVNLSSSFEEKLLAIGDLGLINSYTSHTTLAGRYSWIYNNQDVKANRNFNYIKFNLESSGFLLRQGLRAASVSTDSVGSHNLFGVRFSQYVRPELEFRHYQVIDARRDLVMRAYTGAGFAYDNSNVLPFEKSFVGGGSNGIRAWKARTLGPGSYDNTTGIEQTGDFKFELNLEYRFDVFAILEGALFADAGNIWLLTKDDSRPGGRLEFDKLLAETAVGAGVGFRLNFTFFILRLDPAIKLFDPSQPDGSKWVLPNQKLKDINFNLGIGYPF